jgi:uncharacterized protein (DUF927 family)
MHALGLTGGKNQGREYQPLNPNRSDEKTGSFSINQDSGAWSDFATGDKGGDLVALAGYIWSLPQGKAAERLASALGLSIVRDSTSANAEKKLTGNISASTNADKSAIQPGSKASDDGSICIMPVPDDAPAPFVKHSRHGKPSIRHAYLASDGRVNFYHDRFEAKNPSDKKQFAPLTLWRAAGGNLEWRYKAPPAGRPLYGLDKLVALPDAVVWLVEGEKAADALSAIAPDLVIVSWQGGAQAVDKADFSPLVGRACNVWPDNDEAGAKAANDLVKRLTAAGVVSLNIVNIPALAKVTELHGYKLKAGDDAADLIAYGFDRKKITRLLNSDAVLIAADQLSPVGKVSDSEGKPATFKRHFQVNDAGVWIVEVSRERDSYQAPKRISDRLDVLALSRSPANGEWGLLVAFNDRDHVLHRFIIPARSFNGEGLEATGLLYENGLVIEPKGRPLVLEYLQQQNPDKRARVTNRIGWHGEADDAVFVLPQGAIGAASEEWIFDTNQPNASPFKQRGTLAGWRDSVASLCVGNSRLMFAVSISFAAPLRYLLDIKDLGGFHYRGASSDGKSTALRVAASVCGGSDYMQRWRATDNGLESLAMQHCDAPLFLDELKQLDPKTAGEAAYMLANGAGKARANEKGGARKTSQWRLIFLSAGEVGLSQHMLEANKRVHAGQEIRMADIPADAGAGLGCFENLHDHPNGSAFAKSIAGAIAQNYGVAFPQFIEAVISDRDALPDKLRAAQNAFDSAVLSEAASGQARRVAGIFALVGAAGELATHAGITGWPQGEAFKAAETCFKAWLQGFGGEGNQEARSMLSQVRLYLEQNGEGAFADIDRSAIEDNHAARVTMKAGYRKLDAVNNTLEYYVYSEVFRNVICKGLDYNAVIKLLVERGYMHRGDGRHIGQPKRLLPEGNKRVYHIFSSIFDDENE